MTMPSYVSVQFILHTVRYLIIWKLSLSALKYQLYGSGIGVSDPEPDPDWIRIQSGQWIRIRIRNPDPDPDPGGQK